ncbi:MAG TPA: Zn-dependent alcohol dehydrogenase [Candidatus Eisenbacteria bacterium]|nr:Zn-dependent alcohol dehydrogenase [Candidatus Eisenbacteria bacterium]
MVKAAVLYNFGEALKIDSLKLADPRPDEVVVKLAASGVCHSDLSVQQAKLPFPPPVVLGHEGAGIVEEVGKDVKTLKPGDHVVLSWVENCGRCHYCIAGNVHLCEAGFQSVMTGGEFVFEKDGVSIARMAGVASFSERTVVRATAAIKVPDDVPLDRACLVGCGVMTGVGAAVNTAKVQPGQTVAVYGCGGVGLNVIQGAALCGAGRIIAVDLSPSKLELAKTFGATDLVNGKDGDAPDQIRALTDGLGVDFAFEVIGVPAVIQQAYMSLKRGGKVIVVGVPPMGTTVEIPGQMISLEEKSVIGSLYGSGNMRRDMPRLIDLYQRKRLKLDELVSKRIKLEDVNNAFAAMEKGEVARSVIVF